MKHILIVGGVAGGASAAARLRRLDEDAAITIFERGPDVSFSNCALPYYLSDLVSSKEQLILMDPGKFRTKYNIDVKPLSEVRSIQREKKEIIVRDLSSGQDHCAHYDTLILAPGAKPILPDVIPGVHLPHVFTVRSVSDIARLKEHVSDTSVQDVAVIGGGFIGIEVAENLQKCGKHVTVVEAASQILTPFDDDLVQILHKELLDHEIALILNDSLREIGENHIVLSSGRRLNAQAVVMAIGVKPEVALAEEAGLALGRTGGILVNHNYQTSDPDIYAIGDVIEVLDGITHKPTRLTMAGPAQRQARSAADSIYGLSNNNRGVIGSCVIRLFELNAASTGLNEKAARAAGIPYDIAYVIPSDRVTIMPNSTPIHFKLIYEVPSGQILGAQAISKGSADKRIDVVAAMITMHGTLEDLKELELCYAPLFGAARDAVNQAALVGLNVLYGKVRQIPVSSVRPLVEQGAVIFDVRERNEFEGGHIKTAQNIPLSELRTRICEIPRDRPVYLHCRSGQRSYQACRILINNGFTNIWNISGSYLGLCLYEYFRDITMPRTPIVTNYNFK